MEHSVLSLPLSALFDPSAMDLPYCDLLKKCEEVFESLMITNEQARNIEVSTRDQAQSKTWFRYSVGRVTASKFKAAAHTDLSQPSQSLIKCISTQRVTGSVVRLQGGGVSMKKLPGKHTFIK